jgi:xylulokinase
VLGVDIGSQSIKAVLLDPDGVERGTGSFALSMSHPRGGWAEQDPRDWDEGLRVVIAQCLKSANVSGAEVAVLCLACQVDGVVPLALNGEPLGAGIIWLDRRAHEQADTMAQRVGAQRLFEITGLVADASHAGPKILWLHDHAPEVFERAAAFPPAAGYLLYNLTGRLALDHANASSSLLYDVRARQWSEELLDAFDLGAHRLGEVLRASEVAGTLTKAAAERLGLSSVCSVLVGTGDEHAASIGAGAVTDGMITDVTGTAEPVTVASSSVVLDHERLVETHAHAIDNAYLVENPGFVSGGSTLWFARNVLKVSQTAFFAMADEAPAGADGVLFVPALSGAMTPTWNGHMRGVFAGLAMPHTSATLARAVLEGCAYALRDITDRFESLGLGHHEIRVVGGGAASSTWMQVKADVTGRPVRRVLAPEATALGAAMLAGVAAGIFGDLEDAVTRAVELAPEPFIPDESRQLLYADSYARYRALYRGVEGALA